MLVFHRHIIFVEVGASHNEPDHSHAQPWARLQAITITMAINWPFGFTKCTRAGHRSKRTRLVLAKPSRLHLLKLDVCEGTTRRCWWPVIGFFLFGGSSLSLLLLRHKFHQSLDLLLIILINVIVDAGL